MLAGSLGVVLDFLHVFGGNILFSILKSVGTSASKSTANVSSKEDVTAKVADKQKQDVTSATAKKKTNVISLFDDDEEDGGQNDDDIFAGLSSAKIKYVELIHCVESVQIRSFSGPYFPVFIPNTGKHGPEKLHI